MIGHPTRPSLREFLSGVSSRTGEPLEGAALAEMSGYSVADAQAEGWPDIFAAASEVPIAVEHDSLKNRPQRASAGRRALLRGLTYTLPVVALWSIFPWPVTPPEAAFLALLVVMSWGGSMASSHVVGSWLPGDGFRAWKIAILVATAATLLAGAAGGMLVRWQPFGSAAAIVGAIQVVYFFSASPLMLREHNPGLVVAAVVGATAGAGALLASMPERSPFSQPAAVDSLRMVAAECLVVPALLLGRQCWESSRIPRTPGFAVNIVRRDVAAFGSYGVMFGCLVLWIPIINPSSPAAVLNLVVIGGIAAAEVAVTIMRERSDALLAQPFEATTFAPSARRLITRGIAMYVVPVGLATVALAAFLSHMSTPSRAMILATLTVILLGGVQVLCLIGMSLHGIRPVALAISTCSLALMAMTPFVDSSFGLIALYLGVLTVLGATLLITVMRLGTHPINFI